MKNYVISLTTANNRRQHIQQQFDAQGIDFEFFNAITPSELKAVNKRYQLPLDNAFLTDGEKACLLSHVCLWQKMLDDDLDYVAVFEDDIYLGENADLFFNHSDWLKDNNLDFVKTETFLQERQLKKTNILLDDNRQLHQLQESHLGTAGYIISQKVAQRLLNYTKQLTAEQLNAVDQIIFNAYLRKFRNLPIYQLYPAICIQEFILHPNQDKMPSSIEQSRANYKKLKPKRSLSQKIKGELFNAYCKTLGKLFRTKIIFR